MLRLRVLTALVLAPLALAAVWLLPPPAFAAATLLLAAVALNEWLHLSGIAARTGRLSLIASFIVAGYLLLLAPDWHLPILVLTAAVWLFAALVVLTFPASGPWLRRVPAAVAVGLVILIGAWLALVAVRGAAHGPWLVIWLLVLVWAADAGGYFVGRALGRRRLAPAVSPGKTWEGVAGSVVLGALAAVLVAAVMPRLEDGPTPVFWLLLALPLVAISVVGDLFESTLKRTRGVKDSGTLLPGHGGVLDRVDALLAALPWYALALRGTGLLA
jgi:phosphatidate cytidylyltransferase